MTIIYKFVIKQVPPSSKLIVIYKTIIIKVHPTFLNIYHFIINDDPVLSIAIRFIFFSKIVGCSDKHLVFTKLKKYFWSLSFDRIYLDFTAAEAFHVT